MSKKHLSECCRLNPVFEETESDTEKKDVCLLNDTDYTQSTTKSGVISTMPQSSSQSSRSQLDQGHGTLSSTSSGLSGLVQSWLAGPSSSSSGYMTTSEGSPLAKKMKQVEPSRPSHFRPEKATQQMRQSVIQHTTGKNVPVVSTADWEEETSKVKQNPPANQEKWPCEAGCSRIFGTKIGVMYHLDRAHREKKCPEHGCYFKSRIQRLINDHVIRVHPYSQNAALRIDMRNRLRGAIPRSVGPDPELRPEQREPRIQKMYECSKCKHQEDSKIFLKIHEKNHLPFNCQSCTTRYKNEKGLIDHQKIFHGNEELDIFCEHCRTYFRSVRDFKRHTEQFLRNRKDNVFVCPICGKTFGDRYVLQRHYEYYGHEHYDKCTTRRRVRDWGWRRTSYNCQICTDH